MKDETIIETVDDYLNWYKKDAITIKDYNNYGYRGDGIHQQGIYFLLYKNIVVYVGMTGYNVYSRVSEHTQNKKFDLLKYIPIGWQDFATDLNYNEQLRLGEDVFINIFNPFYNKQNKRYEYNTALNIHKKINKNKIHFELNNLI
jgi:hypothetical protein